MMGVYETYMLSLESNESYNTFLQLDRFIESHNRVNLTIEQLSFEDSNSSGRFDRFRGFINGVIDFLKRIQGFFIQLWRRFRHWMLSRAMTKTVDILEKKNVRIPITKVDEMIRDNDDTHSDSNYSMARHIYYTFIVFGSKDDSISSSNMSEIINIISKVLSDSENKTENMKKLSIINTTLKSIYTKIKGKKGDEEDKFNVSKEDSSFDGIIKVLISLNRVIDIKPGFERNKYVELSDIKKVSNNISSTMKMSIDLTKLVIKNLKKLRVEDNYTRDEISLINQTIKSIYVLCVESSKHIISLRYIDFSNNIVDGTVDRISSFGSGGGGGGVSIGSFSGGSTYSSDRRPSESNFKDSSFEFEDHDNDDNNDGENGNENGNRVKKRRKRSENNESDRDRDYDDYEEEKKEFDPEREFRRLKRTIPRSSLKIISTLRTSEDFIDSIDYDNSRRDEYETSLKALDEKKLMLVISLKKDINKYTHILKSLPEDFEKNDFYGTDFYDKHTVNLIEIGKLLKNDYYTSTDLGSKNIYRDTLDAIKSLEGVVRIYDFIQNDHGNKDEKIEIVENLVQDFDDRGYSYNGRIDFDNIEYAYSICSLMLNPKANIRIHLDDKDYFKHIGKLIVTFKKEFGNDRKLSELKRLFKNFKELYKRSFEDRYETY